MIELLHNFSKVIKIGISQWKVNNRGVIKLVNKVFRAHKLSLLWTYVNEHVSPAEDRDWHSSFVLVVLGLWTYYRLKDSAFINHIKIFSGFKYSLKLWSLSVMLNSSRKKKKHWNFVNKFFGFPLRRFYSGEQKLSFSVDFCFYSLFLHSEE